MPNLTIILTTPTTAAPSQALTAELLGVLVHGILDSLGADGFLDAVGEGLKG